MPYALIAVEVPKDVAAVPTYWLNIETNIAKVEGVQMLTGSLLLLPLPSALPFLGQLTEVLSKGKVTYAISFFMDKPVFEIIKPVV